jgi:hypothetical protein
MGNSWEYRNILGISWGVPYMKLPPNGWMLNFIENPIYK